MPKVTVGIIAYNEEKHIAEAIRSVLKQTFKDYEIIVVDDASSDKTKEIIKSFKKPNIKIIENIENKGVSYSRNQYIKNAKSKYIAVLDADDTWYPEKLELQVRFMDNNPYCVVCGCSANRISSNNDAELWQYPKDDLFIKLRFLWGNGAIHSSVILRSEIITKYKIYYDEQLSQAEDYDLYIRLIEYGKIFNLDKVLVNYNIHDKQLTSCKKNEQLSLGSYVAIKYLRNKGFHLSTEFENVYRKVFEYNLNLTTQEIDQFGECINYLIKENINLRLFNNNELAKILYSKLYMITYENSGIGFYSLKLFLKHCSFAKSNMNHFFLILKFSIKIIAYKFHLQPEL